MTTSTLAAPMLGAFDILLAPRDAYRRLDQRASWLIPLFLVALGTILVQRAMLPYVLRVLELTMPVGTEPEQIEAALRMTQLMNQLGWITVPLLLPLKWLLGALLMAGACIALDVQIERRPLFALLAQVSVVGLLQQITVWMIVVSRGEGVATVADLDPALGFQLLVPSLEGIALAVAQTFSFFTLWWIALLVMGVAHRSGCSLKKAFAVVSPLWLLLLIFRIGLAAFQA